MANNPNDKNRDQNADKNPAERQNPNADRDASNPNRQQQAEQGKQGQQGAGKNDADRAKQQGSDNLKKPDQR